MFRFKIIAFGHELFVIRISSSWATKCRYKDQLYGMPKKPKKQQQYVGDKKVNKPLRSREQLTGKIAFNPRAFAYYRFQRIQILLTSTNQ